MNLKREEIVQLELRDVISHHFSMPEMKLLTSKKSCYCYREPTTKVRVMLTRAG